jgi:dephospho-CoA kinase
MDAKPVIVGLLGGIASGKSTVAARLAGFGALVIDADRIAHEVLSAPELGRPLRRLFGDDAFDAEGRPDRGRIGEAAFADPELLAGLEALVHPAVRERMGKAIEAAGDVPAVVVDAPLLLEGGLTGIADVLVFVEAPTQVRIDRARAQRGWEPGELERREDRQAPVGEKRNRARLTIRNDGTLEDLDAQAEELWREILSEGLPETRASTKE